VLKELSDPVESTKKGKGKTNCGGKQKISRKKKVKNVSFKRKKKVKNVSFKSGDDTDDEAHREDDRIMDLLENGASVARKRCECS